MNLSSPFLSRSLGIVAALATTILSVPSAQAALITFDDLSIPIGELAIPIPNGYQGFNWNNFGSIDAVQLEVDEGPNGYINGLVSPNNAAFNSFGNPAAITILNGTFDFNSVFLTGAWNNGLNITVEGYLGGALQQTQTVVVDTTAPTKFTFNYLGIDEVVFTSFGGTDAGFTFPFRGTQIAIDNLEVNAVVPEPLTMLGAGAAVAFGAAFKRRKA
jgi:hypothetical protein